MMSDAPGNAPDSASATDATANVGLVPELAMMYQALWTSPVRNTLFMQAGAIFIVVAATAYGQILLNNWNKPFYDALSRRDFTEFLIQLGVFGLIAGALLALNVVQRYLGEMSKVKLREGLVEDLIHHWMLPGRASRLAHAGPIGINPDQRMHEDARHLTELSSDLAVGLLQASILLLTFISILWNLSRQFAFHMGGRDVVIPGYMVWAAIIYCASATRSITRARPTCAIRWCASMTISTQLPWRAAKRMKRAISISISRACSSRCAASSSASPISPG